MFTKHFYSRIHGKNSKQFLDHLKGFLPQATFAYRIALNTIILAHICRVYYYTANLPPGDLRGRLQSRQVLLFPFLVSVSSQPIGQELIL